jgi:hypothetical protein
MPFPTTGILDTFNRANEGPPPSANWSSAGGTPQVISNEFAGASASQNAALWIASTFTLPECYATFPVVAAFSAVGWLDGTFSGYTVIMDSGLGSLTLNRVAVGVPTPLGAAFTQTISNGDSLGLQRTDASTLEVWYKVGAGAWTSLGTRTDGTYTGASSLLLSVFDTSARADEFGGGNYVAPTGWGALLSTSRNRLVM